MIGVFNNFAHLSHGMLLCFFIMVSIDLFRQKDKSRLLRFLLYEMVFWVFIELKDLSYLHEVWWSDPYISTINLSIDLWTIPATMLFLFETLSPGWVRSKQLTLMMIPSILFTLLFVLTKDIRVFHFTVAYSVLLGTFSLILVLLASRRYDLFVKKNFSYVENISVTWMRTLIVIMYIVLMLWILTYISFSWLGDVIFYFSTLALWSFIYYNSRQHKVIEVPDMLNPLIRSAKEGRASMENNANNVSKGDNRFTERLALCMEQDKLYLNPKLTIVNVANAIGTNRTYLSDYFNNTIHTTFYEYINAFRLKKASVTLLQEPDMPLHEVAEVCGFNSLSTFRRSFEKEMRLTPAEYRTKKLKLPTT